MHIMYSPVQDILSVNRLAGLFLVDVCANETSVPLVFDTGGSMTVVVKSAAEALGAIPTGESVNGSGNAGAPITMETVRIPNLMLANTMLTDVLAVVLNDAALDFGTDDEGTAIRFHGLLGIDIIRNFHWHFDAASSSFTMQTPYETPCSANMEPWDNMPIVQVLVNGQEELFGFDSGNTKTILGQRLYPLFADCREDTDTFAGVDGKKEESVRRAESFSLSVGNQAITLYDVPVVNRPVFPAKDSRICGLLASDILAGKSWTFDDLNKVLEITDA